MTTDTTAPAASGRDTPMEPDAVLSALEQLFNETVMLHHRMRIALERIHREGALTSARRCVLRELAHRGPLTVPQIACARFLSRQHIQPVVDALARDGLVELTRNPAHKRSRLVRLTPIGKQRIEAMLKRETELLARLPVGASPDEVRGAAAVLRAVRQAMEDGVMQGPYSEVPGEPGAVRETEVTIH